MDKNACVTKYVYQGYFLYCMLHRAIFCAQTLAGKLLASRTETTVINQIVCVINKILLFIKYSLIVSQFTNSCCFEIGFKPVSLEFMVKSVR